MKLIAGLGNPTEKYRLHRHNIGFQVLQFWVSQKKERFQEKSSFSGMVSKFSLGDAPVIALLPLTYMNRSGDAIQKTMAFYKIPMEDVIVIHDEVDLPAGTVRIKRNGGAGTHNGLRSIQPLGSEYLRIRMGIGMPPHSAMDLSSYVLGDFSQSEQQHWEKKFPDVMEILELCITGKEKVAMNRYHGKD